MKIAIQFSGRIFDGKAMKHTAWPIVLFAVSVLATGTICRAESDDWQVFNGSVEFGVTALLNEIPIESPSFFENGYNGAWSLGLPADHPYTGVAQTFSVPSPRTLRSIELRVGRVGNLQPSGQFEVAVYRFDSLSWSPSEKLAAVFADAENYAFELTSVPISSFDFSAFDVALSPTEVYALAVTPSARFVGGILSMQAGPNIYPGGMTFVRLATDSPPTVPEPSSLVLIALCGMLVVRRR